MRRKEEKFASPEVQEAAKKLAGEIRRARLSRNMTQEAAAERARMSTHTWLRIERGDVAASMGAWLSALECQGLLDRLDPDAGLAPKPRAAEGRLRARPNAAARDTFDF
jgi:transcriptional regulator with XRE-family HTH domain